MKNILILGSSSSIRRKILKFYGIEPDFVYSPDIDETPQKSELPLSLAKRLADQKGMKILQNLDLMMIDKEFQANLFVITFDSVVSLGRKILDKSTDKEILRKNLKMLSGRAHICYTSFCLIKIYFDKNNIDKNFKVQKKIIKYSKTRVLFKRLLESEIDRYVELTSQDEFGFKSVYQSESLATRFIKSINGSISGLNGLPLYEVVNSLESFGYKLNLKSNLI